jgi:hypothetical protein
LIESPTCKYPSRNFKAFWRADNTVIATGTYFVGPYFVGPYFAGPYFAGHTAGTKNPAARGDRVQTGSFDERPDEKPISPSA